MVCAIRSIQGLTTCLQKIDGLAGEIQVRMNHYAIAVIALTSLRCPFPQITPCSL